MPRLRDSATDSLVSHSTLLAGTSESSSAAKTRLLQRKSELDPAHAGFRGEHHRLVARAHRQHVHALPIAPRRIWLEHRSGFRRDIAQVQMTQ